jgi:hypothetical protein
MAAVSTEPRALSARRQAELVDAHLDALRA